MKSREAAVSNNHAAHAPALASLRDELELAGPVPLR
jgi:hypothetical protein